ncbi:hypothetical protein LCGC14_0756470 [marine sediment metagenome]|uniref:Uncharacterized protein n=1 Tax=marine sediment metagenome TaxID=412755 RepID=A0A0F9Q2G7_9ZZZZ
MSEDKFVIEYTTTSGFSLEITPLPPYYMDIIDDVYPYKEYPKRNIELLAGDVITEDYELPDEKPDEDDEDYPLWLKHKETESYNAKLDDTIVRVRRDLLLSLCVTVKDGPINIEDQQWIDKVEAPFKGDYTIPEDPGLRRLVFIKYMALAHMTDADNVIQQAMFQEVTLQGIGQALDGFQSEMGRLATSGDIDSEWGEEE